MPDEDWNEDAEYEASDVETTTEPEQDDTDAEGDGEYVEDGGNQDG